MSNRKINAKINVILISVLGAFLAFSTACTKKQKSSYGLDVKETLRINITSEPPSLDWHKATDTTSALITDNIMEGLTEYDYADPELGIKPALATSWESNKNNTVWTFTLRQGVLWTDGVELTAQHFVDGWERLLNPATASEYSYFLFNVKNAQAYNEGKIKDFSQVGVKVNPKGQLVVTLARPQSFFPALLNHHSTLAIRKDLVDKFGDKWTNPENMQTLGAYKLKIWEHDKAIVLERNDSYYGEKAKIKNILALMIQEPKTALNLFDKGDLDALDSLPTLEIKRLKTREEYKATPVLVTYYLGFNVNKKPLNEPLVRKAISMAIDKKEITDLMDGGQKPISGWLPEGMMGFDENVGIKFNPEEARKILAQAGYPGGKGLPKITYGFNTNEGHQRVAENVQAQLKRNLGVDLELKNEEWKVYLKTLNADAYPIFRMGWVADFADPDNFLGLMLSYSENNRGRWKNREFDALIEKGLQLKDLEARKNVYREAQALLLEKDAAVIPVFSSVNNALISKRVKNYPKNAMSRYKYKNTELVQ